MVHMKDNYTLSGLAKADFSQQIDGKETALYVLSNPTGAEVCVTNYGAKIVSLMVPDRNGKLTDVVTGHKSIADYLTSEEPYFGAICGRYGNRIAKGRFEIDGTVYDQLAINNGPNSLHGGLKGFNAKVWANMEAKVRNWAKQNNYTFCDTMYVCKGGTIDNKSQIMKTLSNGLIVPKYYYMAILISKKQSNGTMKYDAMAFWIEHKESSDNGTALAKYVITIDELESKTGIDFFCNLPDDIERQVESTVNMKLWGYN